MRRLARRMLDALTVLSLLLCLATAAVWVRSYWRTEAIAYTSFDPTGTHPNHRGFTASGQAGEVDLSHFRDELAAPASDDAVARGPTQQWQVFRSTGGRRWVPDELLLGLRFGREQYLHSHGTYTAWRLVLPYAWPVALTALPPAAWLFAACRRWRRRDALRRGLCVVCGYDLRASVERCPECGTPTYFGGAR